MKTQQSLYAARNILQREIAAAMNEPPMIVSIQITEASLEETYSVKAASDRTSSILSKTFEHPQPVAS